MEESEVVYRLVPWVNWEEWDFVRESLFSSSPDSIASAFKRVSTWKFRGHLPILIDVTASIIEIQQKDPQFRKELSSDGMHSEGMLAMLYSMAIIRLVNGVVDQDRNKRGKKDKRELSINEAADEIGLPRMLIDIRHEASHRDLPSLRLVREASLQALNWIQSYYWEPQKNAIPFQRDKMDFVRKKVQSKLRELAFHLSTKQDSPLGSLPMKRKRNEQSKVIFGRYCHIFHKAKKLQGSKSRGPKNQSTRILRILFNLYTSFPSEVVAVLLDFFLKALGGNGVEPSDNNGVDLNYENSGITNLCKLVMTRLSSKEPEFILIMLRAVLETLDTYKTMASETGKAYLSCSQSKAEIRRTEQLSSLVLWLIENYEKVKHPSRIVSGGKIHDSSAETNVVPKVALAELIKKCLLVSYPANNQLARAALLLAQILGNSSLVERLKKFPVIRSAHLDCANESSAHTCFDHINTHQESSISQAAQKLEFLKRCRNKDKAANIVASNDDVGKNEGRWTVTKSWNPCPIGMLPCSWGSTGVLPILERAINLPEVQNVPEGKKFWELSRCGGNTYGSHGTEVLEKTDATEERTAADKKFWELSRCGRNTCGSHDDEFFEKTDIIEEGTAVNDGQVSLLEPFRGKLMIAGVYKKVRAEELLAIKSAVRILV